MKINTVNGPADTSDLGATLMHEHIFNISPVFAGAFPDWWDQEASIRKFVDHVERLKKYGLNTIVDASPITLGRNIQAVRRAAELAGIHVIATTGVYFDEVPWMHIGTDPYYLARFYIREITQGIMGTDSKAALVKCATDVPFGLSQTNQMMIAAAAIASTETGVPIITHANAEERYGLEQADILLGYGIPPHKIVIGHAFSSNDLDYVRALCEKGVYVGCDQIGFPTLNSYENLAEMVGALCREGYEDQIFLSHDSAVISDFGIAMAPVAHTDESGMIGDYSQVVESMPALLEREGVTHGQFEKIMRENPRRYLEQIPLRG